MQGILVVNMGGPQSLAEMKQFLWKMFTDKHILPFPKLFRYMLATIITNARYKKSWAKYEQIGGTPLIQSTNEITKLLASKLPEYALKVAYSYNNPLIEEQLQAFKNEGITDVKVISLYPHYSITTLQGVRDDAEAAAKKLEMHVETALPYFTNPSYVKFWAKEIVKHVSKLGYKDPLLIFSGHSIPNIFLKKGDCYPKEIEASAKLIAREAGMEYMVSYQSQIGKKWLGPVTEDVIAKLATQKRENIILVPISFVNENLETLYDMDEVIIPEAKEKLGIKNISRVGVPEVDEDFVAALEDTIRNEQFYGKAITCSLCSKVQA